MSLLTRNRDRRVHVSRETGQAHSSAPWDSASRSAVPRVFARCANPGCRSGWFHLFRKHSTPVFEGGWTCSPECTENWVQAALERELSGHMTVHQEHRHRIPLGLLMLEQGWITRAQLGQALDAQKQAGQGRVGEWLIRQHAADELTVTRALGIQWSCPVLDSAAASGAETVMPRLFIDAFGGLPLRVVAGKLLYLGFEKSLDPVFALALERMTGLRVESGFVPSSRFRTFQEKALNWNFPPVQLGEAVSMPAAALLFTRAIERAQPVASRVVRVYGCLWLRMVLFRDVPVPPADAVRDVVCSIENI